MDRLQVMPVNIVNENRLHINVNGKWPAVDHMPQEYVNRKMKWHKKLNGMSPKPVTMATIFSLELY